MTWLDLHDPDDIGRLAYVCVIGLLLLFWAVTQARRGPWAALRNIALWIAIFAAVLAGYSYRDELQTVGYRMLGMLVPGVPVPGPTPGSVLVAKSRDGHFHVRATIDGHNIRMIVDTGASAVVLTDHDARAIGIHPREDEYTIITSTANGRASTAPVVLTEVTIGEIKQKNVQALVAQPGALDSSLLGNSFLDRLKSFTFEGDRLMLKR